MSTETGAEAHSIVDNILGENGLEAWRRLAQMFDPASAHANATIMGKTLNPPKGKIDHMPFLIEKREDIVRRQGDRAGRQAVTDDTDKGKMMGMCPVESERHFAMNCYPALHFCEGHVGNPGLRGKDAAQANG